MNISVVIATRNRADALKNISLPSLVAQTHRDFEVIIWDASDEELSKCVVEDFQKDQPLFQVRYFGAQRVGSASQRNDAVKVATGEIVFFMDDDSQISADGLEVLSSLFTSQKDIIGGALPTNSMNPVLGRFELIWITVFRKIFLKGRCGGKSKVHLSGDVSVAWDRPGYVPILSGCDMAFRMGIFDDYRFNERLEKFSGYAMLEDQQFTLKLHMEGHKMMIANRGYLIHRAVAGGRIATFSAEQTAAMLYNRFIVWRTAVYPVRKYTAPFFIWSVCGDILFILISWLVKHRRSWDMLRGVTEGINSILSYSP